ncbi:hypothetical protein SDC9_186665 [bioreactor metagenome]|uniref:Uncharacterized protein n=1 Tax=bioreactor metagenome TaxID=1076179 RepID=A0A645HJI1_9ZZZZ
MQKGQKFIDQAVVFKDGQPGVCTQQKIHPHGEHNQHDKHRLLVLALL